MQSPPKESLLPPIQAFFNSNETSMMSPLPRSSVTMNEINSTLMKMNQKEQNDDNNAIHSIRHFEFPINNQSSNSDNMVIDKPVKSPSQSSNSSSIASNKPFPVLKTQTPVSVIRRGSSEKGFSTSTSFNVLKRRRIH